MSVSISEILTGKSLITNKWRAFRWIFGVTVLLYIPIFLFNEATNGLAYRSTVGIWAETVVEFAIFVTVLLTGNRKYGQLREEQLHL
ncbi:MAG: hypothetical protein ACYCZY_07965 [Lacisediminihabitans sp.]